MKGITEKAYLRIAKLAMPRPVFVFARLLLGAFIFFTTFYCLLFYIPFSRHTLFDWNVVTAVSLLARYHVLLYWLVCLPACLTLLPYLADPRLRRLTLGFFLIALLAGICLSIYPLLPNLPADERSLIWSLISLFPLWWLAVLDWKSKAKPATSLHASGDRLGPWAIVTMAAYVAAIYLSIFFIRYVVGGNAGFKRTELMLIAVCSFALHLLLFSLVFAVFWFTDGISRRFSQSSRLGIIFRTAMIAVALAMVLSKVVFSAVSFGGYLADFSALALSSSFMAFISSSLLRVRNLDPTFKSRRLNFFQRDSATTVRRWLILAGSTAGISIFAYATLVNLQGIDWNGLLQRISVLVVWGAAVCVFRSAQPVRPRNQPSLATLVTVCAVSVGLFLGTQFAKPALSGLLRRQAPSVSLLFERYADYDPSFGVAGEVLTPAKIEVFEGSDSDPFFVMLRQNTNIPPEVNVPPVEIKLTENLTMTSAHRPNIFIFVIDSLRQDYLSPYNSQVPFTPAIEAFARESIVMKNGFTRYGGTALAEASIWTGGMQLHKQFVKPFYPMNSLQKMLDVDQYRQYITMDPILKSIVRPSGKIVELDQNVDWKSYDLVRTLSELQSKLSGDAGTQPVFVYSQPQNLHLVSLKANNRGSSSNRHDGFEPQHAFEVERIDKAFGEFVQFLKATGKYDDSVIVLTADHGDSLGEEGHWGHGNSLYPEVMRIPLIIHLPKDLAATMQYDPERVAFSTDITPSLYYLLGHVPVKNDELLGRPLFTVTLAEQQSYMRETYLLADSYGPVYGILRDNGRSLFVADAGKNHAYVYDLTRGYAGRRVSVTDELAADHERAITTQMEKIQTLYNFHPSHAAPNTKPQSSTIAQLYSLLFSN